MTDTGGPAFPPPFDVTLMAALTPQTGALGMTLRDYFAAKAMQAILSSGTWGPKTSDFLHYADDSDAAMQKARCLSEGAYQMADAMLEARRQ